MQCCGKTRCQDRDKIRQNWSRQGMSCIYVHKIQVNQVADSKALGQCAFTLMNGRKKVITIYSCAMCYAYMTLHVSGSHSKKILIILQKVLECQMLLKYFKLLTNTENKI